MPFAIKCNLCVSTESMDQCKSIEKLQECPAPFDSCAKISQEYESGGIHFKAFEKGCSTQEVCEQTIQACTSHSEASCEVDCCDPDGCNGGTVPVVRIFLLATYALMGSICMSDINM